MNTAASFYNDPKQFCSECQTCIDQNYDECECTEPDAEDVYVRPGSETLQYINAYEVGRNYGGPEEGGWWYNCGSPLASIPVTALSVEGHESGECQRCDDARAGVVNEKSGKPWKFCVRSFHLIDRDSELTARMVKHLEETLAGVNQGNIYSVLGGSELSVTIENHVAVYWPERRPHYE